jgi:hypothetical protein
MHRSLPHRLARGSLITLLFVIMALGACLNGGAQASAKPSLGKQPALVNASVSAAARETVIKGSGFTPSGRVYLAIYDQAGARLFEHRWIHASSTLNADQAARLNDHGVADAVATSGGDIDETFTGLCGASAMARAFDERANVWTTWLIVEPKCAVYDSVGGNDLDLSFRLPTGKTVIEFAPGHETIVIDPVLVSARADDGTLNVAGVGFTAGKRVYIAVYDVMGAKLYDGKWVKPAGLAMLVSQTFSISSTNSGGSLVARGSISASFSGMFGANVMIRAYDSGTQTWSNWLEQNVTCANNSGDGSRPDSIYPGRPTKR